jgi:polyisoprenoid-binding protein YceI
MRFRRPKRWIVVSATGVVAIVVAVIVVYFAFIHSDAPPPLGLNSVAVTTGGDPPAPHSSFDVKNLDGTWNVTSSSVVGYRVTEDLVGGLANNTAAGRTNAVTGTVAVAGTRVTAAQISADLTKLKSDSNRRDGQVQTRILNTAAFPKATFTLADPIDVGAIPAVGTENKGAATGDFTIHGVTRRVTFDLTYQLVSASELRILGSIPMVWADWKIPSPSFAGVADVRDNGVMEFLIVATR